MEVLKGVANQVHHSTSVSGSEEESRTQHHARLEVDGQSVKLDLYESIVIDDGDEIVVIGQTKKAVMVSNHYKNLTKDFSSMKPSATALIIFGIIFSIAGFALLVFGFKTLDTDAPNIGIMVIFGMGLLSAALGLLIMLKAMKLSAALKIFDSTI
jgi:hypothetical protein